MQYRYDDNGQALMPWGHDGYEVEVAAVEAITADLPKHAKAVTPRVAAQHLECCEKTVHNMIDSGILLAKYVGSSLKPKRRHRRVVVRIDRDFDPNRKTLLSLEEAKKIFSNIGG